MLSVGCSLQKFPPGGFPAAGPYRSTSRRIAGSTFTNDLLSHQRPRPPRPEARTRDTRLAGALGSFAAGLASVFFGFGFAPALSFLRGMT